MPGVLALAVLTMAGNAPPVRAGFDYCARPVSPSCVNTVDSRTGSKAYKRCEEQVERYVQATYTYRLCLSQQLENEIRRTNDIADRFRCLKATGLKKVDCERRARAREREEAKQPQTKARPPRSGGTQRRSQGGRSRR